jgi:hypothetical protein
MSATTFSPRGLQFLVLFLFTLHAQIQAYTLSNSCYRYGSSRRDISIGMRQAAEEAMSIAGMGGRLVTMGNFPMDNTKDLMFPGEIPQNLGDVQGTTRLPMSRSSLKNPS